MPRPRSLYRCFVLQSVIQALGSAARRSLRGGLSIRLGAVAALAACAALAWPSTGRAYTLRWTERGATIRWNAERVTLRIDPVLAAHAPDMQMAALLTDSAAAWHGLENVPEILIGAGAPGAPGYHKGSSNNGVYWIDEWLHGTDALAVTVVTFRVADGKIVDTDVLVNADFSFAQVPNDSTRSQFFDLPAVLTHELGHVLGLGESCEAGATMWPSVAPGDISQRDLDADDRDGAELLYVDGLWSEPANGGCGGASVLRHVSPGAYVQGYGWGALVALFAVRLRRPARPDARMARSGFAIAGLLCLSAPAVAEDPLSMPLDDPSPCLELPAGDSAAALRAAKLVEGSSRVVTGRAVRVDAYERAGFIWTRFRVEGQGFASVELEVPGGSLGGVTQLVSHRSMPKHGETLVVGLRDHGAHTWAHFRDGVIFGGSLGDGPAVHWEP